MEEEKYVPAQIVAGQMASSLLLDQLLVRWLMVVEDDPRAALQQIFELVNKRLDARAPDTLDALIREELARKLAIIDQALSKSGAPISPRKRR